MVRGLVLVVGLLGGVVWGACPDSLEQGRWVVWMGGHWNSGPVDMRWDPRHRLPKSPQFERLKELIGDEIFVYYYTLDNTYQYPWDIFSTPRRVELGWGRYWGDLGVTLSYWHRHWFYGREDSLGRSWVYWGEVGNLGIEGWYRVGMWKGFSCWVRGGLLRRMGYMSREELGRGGMYEGVGVGGWGSVGGVRVVFFPVPWAGLYAGVLGWWMWGGSGRKYYPWNQVWGYGVLIRLANKE